MTTIKTIKLRGELYIKLESVCDLLEGFGDGETVDTVKRLDELISTIKELK